MKTPTSPASLFFPPHDLHSYHVTVKSERPCGRRTLGVPRSRQKVYEEVDPKINRSGTTDLRPDGTAWKFPCTDKHIESSPVAYTWYMRSPQKPEKSSSLAHACASRSAQVRQRKGKLPSKIRQIIRSPVRLMFDKTSATNHRQGPV